MNGEKQQTIAVIGSGIGGMACGALFAKSGHTVHVLEQHESLIGGHGRCLSFQNLSFSMGPQYVWHFKPGDVGDRFLRYLELDREIRFLDLEEDGFERIFIGKKYQPDYIDFKVPLGLDNFRNAMTLRFPEYSKNLNSFFDDMQDIYNAYIFLYGDPTQDESWFRYAADFLFSSDMKIAHKVKFLGNLFSSVKDFFDKYNLPDVCRRVLYGHGGIFAENESHMSAVGYVVATANYHQGARYPEKGFYTFFSSLKDVIERHGGTVQNGKTVTSIEIDGDSATRVVCSDGTSVRCDVVLSDISPRLTCNLLPEKYRVDFSYQPSHSVPTICIGLKKGIPSLRNEMRGRNFWWQDGNEVDYDSADVTKLPSMLFINSPTAHGFGDLSGNDEMDNLVVFCPGNYDQEKGIYKLGPEAVAAWKKDLAHMVVDIIDTSVIPGVRENLVFAEVISSVDIEHDTLGEKGNAYGTRLTVKEILKTAVPCEYPVSNLYNVSASYNAPGIASGIKTGVRLLYRLTGIRI